MPNRRALLLLIGAAAAGALGTLQAARADTAIVGATLVDVSHAGHASHDIANAVVLVRNGRIAAAGNRAHVRVPARATVIHAEGRYLIPGLIDGFGAIRTQGFADAYLYEGVTTVYVAIAPPGGRVDGQDRLIAAHDGPSVLTGGAIGGYAMDGSVPPTHPWTDHRAKDVRLDKQHLIAAVDAAAKAGKRGLTVGFDVWPDQLKVIVAEAHRRHLAVTAELAYSTYAEGLAAGVDAFIRNDKYPLSLAGPAKFAAYAEDPLGAGGRPPARAVCGDADISAALTAFGDALKGSRTALMPMLSMEATADDLDLPNPWTTPAAAFVAPADLDDPVDPRTGARPYLDAHPDRRAAIQDCARHKQAIDRRLHALGATYLAGSSAPGFGVMPGSGLHGELRLLQEVGLTPREALAAATSNFADVYGWRDRGRLEPGRRADLVILTADPRLDAAAADSIAEVMVGGRMVNRDGLVTAAQGRRR
jgi:hypothetical protein